MHNPKIAAMTEGGKRLALIKSELVEFALSNRHIPSIDQQAEKLILKAGGRPSFKQVPGYRWSICLNRNDSIVHGIPHEGYLADGDLVTIDIGMLYQGFHTDTAISFIVADAPQSTKQFLRAGYEILHQTIAKAKPGKTVRHLSQTMQQGIESHGYQAARQLTGHGVGRQLHMEPPIPCYVTNGSEMSVKLQSGMTIAIEVMYTEGNWLLTTDKDGWTMRTKDGKLSAVVEETVLITDRKPIALTAL